MNTLDLLINEERKDYKCFDMLKELYQTNEEFKQFIDEGVSTGKVEGFSEELWQKIDDQNLIGLDTFERVFQEGANIGACTPASRQLSYSFQTCELCSGLLPIISGTKNSPIGNHSWMKSGNKVYDTSLMIIMDKNYADKLGYKYEAEYNPNLDDIYCAAKEFANDPSIKGPRR